MHIKLKITPNLFVMLKIFQIKLKISSNLCYGKDLDKSSWDAHKFKDSSKSSCYVKELLCKWSWQNQVIMANQVKYLYWSFLPTL